MLNRTAWSFIFKFAFIVFIAILVWASISYFNSDARKERQTLKYFDELKEEYENDTYGGRTPEETLELFISALEAEDIELASKYFVIYEREELSNYINNINKNNNINLFVKELRYPYTKRAFGKENNYFIFDIFNNIDNTHIIIDVIRGSNDIWKILSI